MGMIKLKPIGFVENNIKKLRFGKFTNEVSEIIINKKFTKALTGIEKYSHIVVVYWMDKVKDYVMTHQPQDKKEVPIVGIFACRCPQRPNPIGITTVKLMGRRGNKLKVKGLDVLNRTPIIDVKPYWPQYDKVVKEKMPGWINKLEF